MTTGYLPIAKKTADDVLPIEIDLFRYCTTQWKANEYTEVGDVVHLYPSCGWALKAARAGTTGCKQPSFNGSFVTSLSDGSVLWDVIPALTEGVNAASSPTPAVSPSGLTVSAVSVSEDRKLLLSYSGGTAGTTYTVSITFTVNGIARVLKQEVQVL